MAAALAMGSATAWALPGKTAATIETESPEPPSSAAASAEEERAALNAELFYEILVGEIAASEGALGDAQAMMMEAARTSGSEQLYRRGTELALQSRSGERATGRQCPRLAGRLSPVTRCQPALQQRQRQGPAADVVEQAMAGETDNPASGPLAWATIGHMRLGAGQRPQPCRPCKGPGADARHRPRGPAVHGAAGSRHAGGGTHRQALPGQEPVSPDAHGLCPRAAGSAAPGRGPAATGLHHHGFARLRRSLGHAGRPAAANERCGCGSGIHRALRQARAADSCRRGAQRWPVPVLPAAITDR